MNSNRDYGKKSGTPSVRKMAEGGEVDDRPEVSHGSLGDRMRSLGNRLTAGNIDEKGSRAYNTWGEGQKTANVAEDARFERASRATEPSVDMPAPEPRKAVGSTEGLAEPKKANTGGFKSAFAAARKAGTGDFEWNGKKYSTKLADDKPAKKAAPAPTPAAPAEPATTSTAAGDFQRSDKDRRNVDDIRTATQSGRDRKQAEDTEQTPIHRGVKAAADWLSKGHGPKLAKPAKGTPSIYAGSDAWAAHGAKVAKHADGGFIGEGVESGVPEWDKAMKKAGAPEAAKPGERVDVPSMGRSDSFTGGLAGGLSAGAAMRHNKGVADREATKMAHGGLVGGDRYYGKK